MSIHEGKFLGAGWSFPVTFEKVAKEVELRKGYDDIKESLEILLATEPGERLYDPKFGCDLTPLLFETLNLSLKTIIADRIKRAIVSYEPRIDLEDVQFIGDQADGVIQLSLIYVVRATNSRTNMVFPYYLEEGTDL